MNSRQRVIVDLLKQFPNAFFVFSNGLTSREAVHCQREDRCFYLLHAMGEALAVGIGLAKARPELEVVVVDGDYNAIMGLSSWSMMPVLNLKYVVLVNETSETTGGQTIPPFPFIPVWCTFKNITQEKLITPNPPPPDEIWEKSQAWLFRSLNGKAHK